MSSYTPLKPGFKRTFLNRLRLHPAKGGYLQVAEALVGRFYGNLPDDNHASYWEYPEDSDDNAEYNPILKDPTLAEFKDVDAFCCLGVACNILIEQGKAPYGWDDIIPENTKTPDGLGGWSHTAEEGKLDELSMPPKEFCDKMGLSAKAADKLAKMNDDGRSFAEIADWIEAHL